MTKAEDSPLEHLLGMLREKQTQIEDNLGLPARSDYMQNIFQEAVDAWVAKERASTENKNPIEMGEAAAKKFGVDCAKFERLSEELISLAHEMIKAAQSLS